MLHSEQDNIPGRAGSRTLEARRRTLKRALYDRDSS